MKGLRSTLGTFVLVPILALAYPTVGRGALTSPPPPPPASFITTLGWEDDVDIVVAPDREFLVFCDEEEDGSDARLWLVDLDPATGNVLSSASIEALGFENGVDPLILPELEPGTGYPVLVPVENESGSAAGLIVLLLDADAGVLQRINIATGPLGFRPDVDGVWTHYTLPAVAFFPMESENHGIRGVLAVDADPRPAVGAGDFGGCTLLSTAGLGACGGAIVVSWLPGLADAVDPVAYEKIGCCARLALPVVSPHGTNADVQLIDFDPTFEPPGYSMHRSVKAVNSAGARPTVFPGFERDVDMKLFQGECGFAQPTVMVPVEGPGNVADLYMLDQDGVALWTLSHDSGAPTLSFPGFERGVDLVPMCDLGGADPRVAVPVENATGTDANLWMVRLSDGNLIAHVEDPVLNPGTVVAGYEVGVDPVLWTNNALVIPVEGLATPPGLIVVAPDGHVVSAAYGGSVFGFRRSVDLLVDTAASPHLLYVPVVKEDGSDANLLIGNDPPDLGGVSFEAVNFGEEMTDYEWDVDLGLVNKLVPGGAFLYLPEEDDLGMNARLRIQEVPTGARLAIATRKARGLPASLYFVGLNPFGEIISKTSDLLGLETGLDMADGRGPVARDWEPNRIAAPGQDGDSDPTLAWLDEPTSGALPEDPASEPRPRYANPFVPPDVIGYTLPGPGAVRVDILDVRGVRVRRLVDRIEAAGDHTALWDGLDEQGDRVGSGIYFVSIRGFFGGGASKLMIVH